jgi:hypothetical protein
MNFLAKTQNDTHEKCMNDPFFHEGYSPGSGMYEFSIQHDFYPIFSSFRAPALVRVLGQISALSPQWQPHRAGLRGD